MLTVEDVRIFLQDYPEANRLLEGVEFTSERILKAIDMTICKYNEMPPLVDTYIAETFPYKHHLLLGVIVHLLRSEGLNSTKNRLNYSTGGNAIDDMSKAGTYLEIAERLNAEFLSGIKNLKIAKNIKQGFGHISSEYAYINSNKFFHN